MLSMMGVTSLSDGVREWSETQKPELKRWIQRQDGISVVTPDPNPMAIRITISPAIYLSITVNPFQPTRSLKTIAFYKNNQQRGVRLINSVDEMKVIILGAREYNRLGLLTDEVLDDFPSLNARDVEQSMLVEEQNQREFNEFMAVQDEQGEERAQRIMDLRRHCTRFKQLSLAQVKAFARTFSPPIRNIEHANRERLCVEMAERMNIDPSKFKSYFVLRTDEFTHTGSFNGPTTADGWGVRVWRDGSRYEGHWSNGRESSLQGKFVDGVTGEQRRGRFRRGKHVQGTRITADGTVDVGDFGNDGKLQAKGRRTWSDGRKLKGVWVNRDDRTRVKGVFTDAQGVNYNVENSSVGPITMNKPKYTFVGKVPIDVIDGTFGTREVSGVRTYRNGDRMSGTFTPSGKLDTGEWCIAKIGRAKRYEGGEAVKRKIDMQRRVERHEEAIQHNMKNIVNWSQDVTADTDEFSTSPADTVRNQQDADFLFDAVKKHRQSVAELRQMIQDHGDEEDDAFACS